MRDVLVVVGVALVVVVMGLAVVLGISARGPSVAPVAASAPTIVVPAPTQVRATVSVVTPAATSAPARPTATATTRLKLGANAFLYATGVSATTGGAVVADAIGISREPSGIQDYVKSLQAHDSFGVLQLVMDDRLILVDTGTPVLVIDLRPESDAVRVRVMSGPKELRTGWADQLWVVTSLPDGYVPTFPHTLPTSVSR